MAKTNKETFDNTYSGSQPPPLLPTLRNDPPQPPAAPQSLESYRELEDAESREKRIRKLFKALPSASDEAIVWSRSKSKKGQTQLKTPEEQAEEDRREKLRSIYNQELMNRVGGGKAKPVDYQEFVKYAEAKEAELWSIFHDELDLDGNGRLDAYELRTALGKAGITLQPSTLSDFMNFLSTSPHSQTINFTEFRDFLILMPRKASTAEIYRYYEFRKNLGDDGHGNARVNMEGDVSLSAEDRPRQPKEPVPVVTKSHEEDEGEQAHHEHHDTDVDKSTAFKFLVAGGVAGAVSRTATAPFDRLKVFLATRPVEGSGPISTETLLHPSKSTKALWSAAAQIYKEGGIRGYWIGNGLNIVKIFPESAIKFLSYESSKRLFAKYVDHVEDSREISGTSRFLSGGIGGLTSQLSIYPIETLKTRLMSETHSSHILPTMKQMWREGKVRTFYRGLVIGLVGVFPYSAIDMSTFEALKLAYLRSTGLEEPGVLALLAFGSISGSVGATSVYPLNLVRTRLQASGSSGHPQVYTGMWDVVRKTHEKEGLRGFYRGLFPTLAKVVPAVSISYVVYESTKRRLGVGD
ncbi:mitochondrial carrier [Serendipita vermifera]|nr:mitochondrial carrier [Serendipita vermifera]